MTEIKDKELYFIDLTEEYIRKAKLDNQKVRKLYYFYHNNKIYKVDGKNVVLDYTNKEKKIAKWIKKTFGGEIFLVPRINYPKGISTPDYIWNNEKWDLKELGKNAISELRAVDNSIKKSRKQNNNIILDISNSILKTENIINQVERLFQSEERLWLQTVMIIKNKKLVKILKRK